MNNLVVSFNAVAPTCLIVIAGMVLRKLGIITEAFVKSGGAVVFKVLMPVLIFSNIYFADLGDQNNASFIIYGVAATVLGFALCALICRKTISDWRRAASFAQGLVRSNYLVVGLSMATELMGEGAAASIAVLAPFVVGLFAVCSNVIFAVFKQEGRVSLRQVLRPLARTPIIWGIVLAVLLRMVHLPCPQFLRTAVKNLGSSTSPIALLILGAQMDLCSLGRNMRPVLLCTFGKLVVVPTLQFLPALAIRSFNRYELVALFFAFYTPGAINAYFEAQAQGADAEFSGEVVVLTNLLSFITLFSAIFIMKTFGVF